MGKKIHACFFCCLLHQSNRYHVQTPEPEHHPGTSPELRGLSDEGRADRAAGKLACPAQALATSCFVPS